jgi:PAS domain S-box-containing protein
MPSPKRKSSRSRLSSDRTGAAGRPARKTRVTGHQARLLVAEQALADQTRILKSIIDSMGDGVIVCDPQGRFILYNPAAEMITGIAATDSSPDEWARRYGIYLPDGVTPCASEDLPLARGLRGEQVDGADLLLRHPARPQSVWVSATARPLRDGAGRIHGAVVVFRDVTATRRAQEALAESERRFREMLENVRMVATMLDERGNILFCNDYLLQLTGWRRDEVLGRNWFETFLPGESHAPILEIFRRGTEAADIPPHYENEIVTRAGARRLIAWNNTLLRDRDGRVVGTTSLGVDITDARRLEEELARAGKLESIGVLAGGIAHDFNNILTAVLGNILLVKSNRALDDTARRRLREAEDACLRARGLTQQILTFAKGGDPVKRITALDELVHQAADLAVSGSNVRCDTDLPPSLWPVEIDVGLMRQALHNLLLNARQAMPDGGTVKIQAENLAPGSGQGTDDATLAPGPYVALSITDGGPGISRENLPRVFDPYFSTRESAQGLGLSIAYSVVTRHGGRIEVTSTPGSGATFRILLPAAPDAGGPTAAPEDGTRSTAVPRGGRILVMDDEPMIREVTGAMLAHFGFQADPAADGEEALALYEEARRDGRPYTAVMLDLTIPGGMGGRETLARLKAIDPGVRAIVSSGYSNDPIMSNFKAYGFRSRISKPFVLEDLERALREALEPANEGA